jgi:hypothetical protein
MCCRRAVVRVTAKLPIEIWMAMRIHAPLENLGIHGPIEEASSNAQCADVISASPRTNAVAL